MEEWTDEQVGNAMKYGICTYCGAPRELRTWGEPTPQQREQHGATFTNMGIRCPNCDQGELGAEALR